MSKSKYPSAAPFAAFRLVISLVAILAAAAAYGVDYGQYGPYDYYSPPKGALSTPPKGALSLVERAHMGAIIVGQRREGRWCDYWGSLDYALRAFPNHPEALKLMSEYLDEHPACLKPPPVTTSSPADLADSIEGGAWRERNADYYFEKGVEFKPKESNYVAKRPETRVLYGKYLYTHRRPDEALTQFKEAEKLQPSSVEANYYLGMIYLDKNDTQKAKSYAQKAYKLGQPPPDLKQKLVTAGQWREK